MKNLVLVVSLIMTINLFANCNDVFISGVSNYDFAQKYFEKGMKGYNDAVSESESPSGRLTLVCDLLTKANTGFDVATDSFKECKSVFDTASGVCTGADLELAQGNSEVCNSNFDIADDNYKQIKDLLKNTCFKTMSFSEINLLQKIESLNR